MKALRLIRAFIASFALALGTPAMAGNVIPPAGVTGPWLGDFNVNLSTIVQALQQNAFVSQFSLTTMTTTLSTQAGCTQLNYGYTFLTVTLGGAGSVCLPAAKNSAEVDIANNTSQQVSIYGVTPSTAALGVGGTDYINGVAGTTNYAGLTNGKITQCIAIINGSWWCSSGN